MGLQAVNADRETLEASAGALRDNAKLLDALARSIEPDTHPVVVAVIRGADALRSMASAYDRVAKTAPERGINFALDLNPNPGADSE